MLKRMWRSIAGKANPSMPSGRFNGSRLALSIPSVFFRLEHKE
jgi:hypothetical protein